MLPLGGDCTTILRTAHRAPWLRILAAIILWVSAGSGAGCGVTGSSPASPKAIAPDGHEFRLEIAATPEQQARGYMYRERVGRNEGMLFIFPSSDFHSFWMKNCLISLDILWLSEDLSIVHLEQEVPPCRKDPCPSYPSMSKARYVLEVASGMAGKHGMRVGGKIRVTGLDLESAHSEP
jgi:uncharacterized protein